MLLQVIENQELYLSIIQLRWKQTCSEKARKSSHGLFWRTPEQLPVHVNCDYNLKPALLTPPSVSGVGVARQLCSVQVFPARGEHGDQRVLLGRYLPAAAAPGSLPVGEGPAAVPQPLPAGEAQVTLTYLTESAPRPPLSHWTEDLPPPPNRTKWCVHTV